MKVSDPYKCDCCKQLKGEGNKWWLCIINRTFIVIPWDPAAADVEATKHLCSADCVNKLLNEWMGIVQR